MKTSKWGWSDWFFIVLGTVALVVAVCTPTTPRLASALAPLIALVYCKIGYWKGREEGFNEGYREGKDQWQ